MTKEPDEINTSAKASGASKPPSSMQRADLSFLNTAACAISSVYVTTQSFVATTEVALVAVVIFLRLVTRR